MADSFVNIYGKEFGDNIMFLSRQKTSKMLGKVMMKSGIKGNKFTQERIGVWTLSPKSQGVQATPTNDPGMSRRTITMVTSTDARQAARDDDLKTKVSITSPWVKAASAAYGKLIDTTIYTALGGNAYSDVDGGTAVALPAGQKLATVAGTSLTTDFLITVKDKMDAADVPEEGRYCMIHPSDLNGLLGDDKATTADSNTIKALVKGEMDTWLGFNWIPTTAATQGVCYFYQEDGIVLGMNETPYVDVRIRRDLSDAQEIYYELNVGAGRLEEERVVEVTITPAATS